MNTTYLYHTPSAPEANHAHLQNYALQQGFKDAQMLKEEKELSSPWQERTLAKTLKQAKAGDTVIAYDSLHLANSASQLMDILNHLVGRGVSLHFAKYNMTFNGKEHYNIFDLISLLRKAESDYVSHRNVLAIEHRRNMGVVLGRPKGRKNKALKLDKFKKEITRYLELSISKASIAKLVNCHPQTLYDWIERNSIPDRKPRKPSVRKLSTV